MIACSTPRQALGGMPTGTDLHRTLPGMLFCHGDLAGNSHACGVLAAARLRISAHRGTQQTPFMKIPSFKYQHPCRQPCAGAADSPSSRSLPALCQVHVAWLPAGAAGTAVFAFRGTSNRADMLADIKVLRRQVRGPGGNASISLAL